MKTLEQHRAAHAIDRVARLQDHHREFKRLYRTYVDRLGPGIVMNGLGQALATELAAASLQPKNNRQTAHLELYASVQDWLCRGDGVYPAGGDLLQAIVQHDQADYLRAQTEALAWLEWHKKCCRATFPASEEDGE